MNKKERISIEVKGRTVQEALKKALKQLNLARNKVEVEVLCEEVRGLFGMQGVKPAKIRVTPKQ